MNEFKTSTFGRVAISTLLSAGLLAGTVGIASATTQSSAAKSHASAKTDSVVVFQGTITALSTGSFSVANVKGVTQTFTTTAATKILRATNMKNLATLAMGERVVVRSLTSAPTVATTINILGAKAKTSVVFQGTVSAVGTGSVSVVSTKGTTETFTISSTTKVLRASNVKHAAILAKGERVIVRSFASAPNAAITINIVGAKK